MVERKNKRIKHIYCSRYTRKDGKVMIAKDYGLKAWCFTIII